MRRLLTHLAQFSSLSKQGEVLCTRGLEFLLENLDAREILADFLSIRSGLTVSGSLEWRAEVRQHDMGRPDLEGCTVDNKPEVKIEAKLGATLSEGQLRSYVTDLVSRAGGGLLIVMVPRYRTKEANELTRKMSWPDQVTAIVASWDDILGCLGAVTTEPFAGDLAQFTALYRALSGDDVEPLPDAEAIREWRAREDIFINFVDRASRELARGETLMPMDLDARRRSVVTDWDQAIAEDDSKGLAAQESMKVPRGGYLRRYVCRAVEDGQRPCFSVGVRDPFSPILTPIWLRFNKGTPGFSAIRSRLRASAFSNQMNETAGHVWLPLNVPLNADAGAVIDSLVEQAERVFEVARGAGSASR